MMPSENFQNTPAATLNFLLTDSTDSCHIPNALETWWKPQQNQLSHLSPQKLGYRKRGNIPPLLYFLHFHYFLKCQYLLTENYSLGFMVTLKIDSLAFCSFHMTYHKDNHYQHALGYYIAYLLVQSKDRASHMGSLP